MSRYWLLNVDTPIGDFFLIMEIIDFNITGRLVKLCKESSPYMKLCT